MERGSSLSLYCEHNVDPKILYKVSCEPVSGLVLLSFITFHVNNDTIVGNDITSDPSKKCLPQSRLICCIDKCGRELKSIIF